MGLCFCLGLLRNHLIYRIISHYSMAERCFLSLPSLSFSNPFFILCPLPVFAQMDEHRVSGSMWKSLVQSFSIMGMLSL